jgi:NADP-dependent aldehyde dehydrogenase
VTAVRRFLRPLAWQAAPVDLLPVELRDDFLAIPRRVDGQLVLGTPA